MSKKLHSKESGIVSGWMLSTIGLIILCTIVGSLCIWLYINYTDQKDNTDSKVDTAVAEAKKAQADTDEAKYVELEKEPNREFVGPEDYGRLTFNYPKTWSVYVGKDVTSGGSYEAYLNPVMVLPVTNTQQYALRVTIEEKDFDKVLASYDSLVKKGSNGGLVSSSVVVDGTTGTRLDGNFSKDIRGSAVIFKIRDKTLTVRTDANTFANDYNALIKTIKFNQ